MIHDNDITSKFMKPSSLPSSQFRHILYKVQMREVQHYPWQPSVR